MRRLFCWQISVLLLSAGVTAGAQVANPSQNAPSADNPPLRSVALGDSGDGAKAVSDLRTAVGLDPSLAAYVTIKGKTVVLGLPPL